MRMMQIFSNSLSSQLWSNSPKPRQKSRRKRQMVTKRRELRLKCRINSKAMVELLPPPKAGLNTKTKEQ